MERICSPNHVSLNLCKKGIYHRMIPFPDKKYRTIYADPPWQQGVTGQYSSRHGRPKSLCYPLMALSEIINLPVADLAEEGCHLWLWTSNQFLREGFEVMEAWGFKYLAPITWVKPSGVGNYFVHRTQTMLFGYKGKCIFPSGRFKPTVFMATCPKRHSEKPLAARELVESISPEPRIELFARPTGDMFAYEGWDLWGNEV
jgi:N6-adenosine-specific RNA methylase IME4